ncbi:hypothetical protein [Gemella sp. zg-1178]|uniref:hypothetical protein n=1 Tax=Gemella sp. zg-1178 TaxID=2840372 RepID=UPI001C03C687|nr:hypothetical protein [Gemella sp. zg-1178]MBU0279340.1 hypothetical protein [Gemella sp. zg-1178]
MFFFCPGYDAKLSFSYVKRYLTSSIVDYTTLINVKEKIKDVVTLDDRTSDQCAVCAGNIYDIEDAPILPRHPRCRCVLVAYIDVDTLAKGFDREEASVNKALTYKSVKYEWLKNYKEPKVTDMNYWEYEGVKYFVDGKHVVLDYS